MAKYFTIDELTRSSTAERLGIDNTPRMETCGRLETLAERLLDPVRELWGAPLTVNSGYRCGELNRVVGGAAGSQHLAGEAADITTGSVEGNRRLFGLIVEHSRCSGSGSGSGFGSGSGSDADPVDGSAGDPAGCGGLEFDQLIDERGYAWLHLSYREGRNRKQILHLK